MKKIFVAMSISTIAAFGCFWLLDMIRHTGFVVSANSNPAAHEQANGPPQPEKGPVIMFVDRGAGKYHIIYSMDGKAVDPHRLDDAREKYGFDVQFYVVVDSRLPIDTVHETDAFLANAGFSRRNIRYFANYGGRRMSEIAWGPDMMVPGQHLLTR